VILLPSALMFTVTSHHHLHPKVRGATSPFRQQSLEFDGDNFCFFTMTKLHLKRLNVCLSVAHPGIITCRPFPCCFQVVSCSERYDLHGSMRPLVLTCLRYAATQKLGCHGHTEAPWTTGRGSSVSMGGHGGIAPRTVPEKDADPDQVVRPSFSDDHALAVPTLSRKQNSNERAASLVEEGVLDEIHAEGYIESSEHLDAVKENRSNGVRNSSAQGGRCVSTSVSPKRDPRYGIRAVHPLSNVYVDFWWTQSGF
jgi:hypothetical protein